jgi:lipoyl(octanoyl) transferase
MREKIQVKELGLLDYKAAWDLQEEIFQHIVSHKKGQANSDQPVPSPHQILMVEHPHVYTLGKSGKMDHLLVSEEALAAKGAAFYKINRGGDITYHGPGQLVVYPILDLESFFKDIHKYLRLLEEAVIRTLKEHGISSMRSPGETGVWLDVGTPFARKICAMGVRASRWVTMHGLALNIAPDMGYFDLMIPCGIKDKSVTSMTLETRKPVDAELVKKQLLQHISDLFEADIIAED